MAKMTLEHYTAEFGMVEIEIDYTLYSKDVLINDVKIPLVLETDTMLELKEKIKAQLKLERECPFADEDRFYADHVESEVMGTS